MLLAPLPQGAYTVTTLVRYLSPPSSKYHNQRPNPLGSSAEVVTYAFNSTLNIVAVPPRWTFPVHTYLPTLLLYNTTKHMFSTVLRSIWAKVLDVGNCVEDVFKPFHLVALLGPVGKAMGVYA